jgi:hypothetical protein
MTIKCEIVRWARNVVCVVQKLKIDDLQDPDVDGRLILKWIVKN